MNGRVARLLRALAAPVPPYSREDFRKKLEQQWKRSNHRERGALERAWRVRLEQLHAAKEARTP